MIAIKVTDSYTFLRQDQQLREKRVHGVRRSFNIVTEKDRPRGIAIPVTIVPPTGNTRRKRMVLCQHGMQQLENSYLIWPRLL